MFVAGLLLLISLSQMKDAVFFQAHRGGVKEVPENTLAAYRHAWSCPGAVPEMDVCVTQDGVMVCMHDETPGRTTNAPKPFRSQKISTISSDEIRRWDAGSKFDAKYAGEKVPLLTEVFEDMQGRPERQAYLDIKDVDLDKLSALIGHYGLREQIIFVHGDPEMCERLKGLYPRARTMTWLSGKPDEVKRRFGQLAEGGFKGLSQLQFHLAAAKTQPEIEYVLDADFLRGAVQTAKTAGVDLQLRPFEFDAKSLRSLLNIGVRWFVTDEPRRFADTIAKAMETP